MLSLCYTLLVMFNIIIKMFVCSHLSRFKHVQENMQDIKSGVVYIVEK